ncbi:MAG: hypothetical protein ACI9JU_001321, partial [Pseudohongiellaceae bacterium]
CCIATDNPSSIDMGGCACEALATWLCLGSLGGMPVRLSGLNLSIGFFLLI